MNKSNICYIIAQPQLPHHLPARMFAHRIETHMFALDPTTSSSGGGDAHWLAGRTHWGSLRVVKSLLSGLVFQCSLSIIIPYALHCGDA